MTNALYLGDGVYAQQEPDCNQLVLTTGCHYDYNNGDTDNTIYLEHEVIRALLSYIKTHYPVLYENPTR